MHVGTNHGESARTLLNSDVDIFVVSMVWHSITNVCQARTQAKHEATKEIAAWGMEYFVSRKAKLIGGFRFTIHNSWKSVSANTMTEAGKSLLKSPNVPLESCRILQLFAPLFP